MSSSGNRHRSPGRAKTSGSESDALAGWIRVVEEEYGGKASANKRGLRLKVDSSRWANLGLPSDLLIAREPETPEEWRHRLRVVEQMAARALTAKPYAYSVALDARSISGAKQVEVLRCAVGMITFPGPALLHRLTAYHIQPWNVTFCVEGDDSVFELNARTVPAGKEVTEKLRPRVEKLCAVIDEASKRIPESPAMRAFTRAHGDRMQQEVKALESLYFDRYHRRGLLNGVPIAGLTGDRAVEAEYRRRLESIVNRYSIKIQPKVLSIGLISCMATRVGGRDTKAVLLPFAELSND
jgi:hypothetical protein